MTTEELRLKTHDLTESPGIYLMKDNTGKVIYVGKAKNLKNRVSSYFINNSQHTKKTKELVSNIDDYDFITVETEFEALVLECAKIKEYRPRYNILMNDDSRFHYIVIKGEYPKITAEAKPSDDGECLGAFTSSYATSQTVQDANNIFRLPTCNRKFPEDFGRFRPCINYHIKQCCGVCTGKVNKEEYLKTVQDAVDYIKNGSDATIAKLTNEMQECAENLLFEKAARLRDRIKFIQKSWDEQRIITTFHERADTDEIALNELKNLLGLVSIPKYIESYDISNLGSSEIVAAMVVFKDACPYKKAYKKFKLKTVTTQDDYGSFREILTRRFKRFLNSDEKDESFKTKPDLIFVDGGKGQVSVARKVLADFGLTDIPVFGLVKDGKHKTRAIANDHSEIITSQSFNLITRIQDETHRFAISYQRRRREMKDGL